LRLVARHHSSKDIARHLVISQHTVDGHLDEARRKLGATTRRDAARILIEGEGAPPEKSGGGPAFGGGVRVANSGGEFDSVAVGPDPQSRVRETRHGEGDAYETASLQIATDSAEVGAEDRRKPRHELTPAQRLGAIVLIAVASVLVLTLLLLGAQAFTFLIQEMSREHAPTAR